MRHGAVAAYTLLLPESAGTADLVPIEHVSDNPYGINVFLEQEVEETKVRQSLEMIRSAGFSWIKQQMVWHEIERPAKGEYVDTATDRSSWAKYDRIVDLAEEYGLRVIFRIDTSPEWARTGQAKLESPPDDFEDYGDFVETVAARYRDRAVSYQIWNEPNLPFEWGNRPPDPEAYSRLLRIAYERIKQVDPNSIVISAALAPTTELSEKGMNDLVYLQRMYDAGARGTFDVLGVNAYGLRSGPLDRRLALDRDVNFSRPILVRQVMVKNGDANRPMWASEVGWNALPEDFPAVSLWGRVDRILQAQYTVQAFDRAQREWPWMGVMNLWHFRLVGADRQLLQQYYFNAVDEEFRPMPLFTAMSELMRQPAVVERGYRQEDHFALSYSSDWAARSDDRAVNGGYRESLRAGATVEARFRGTHLELVVDSAPDSGALMVTIDGSGALAGGLKGPARIETRSGSPEWGRRIVLANGLTDGVHVVRMTAADARPVRIDGLIVDRRSGWPYSAPELIFILAAATAIIAIAGIGSVGHGFGERVPR